MKVILAHDFLNQLGGAERVLKSFTEIYPEAPIYTLFGNEEFIKKYLGGKKVFFSFLQRKNFLNKNYKYLLPLFPLATESLNFEKSDIILSSTTAWMKGVVTKPEVCHICYCHSPTRFLWDWTHQYVKEQNLGKIKKNLLAPILTYLRLWDFAAAQRVDYFVANSKNVQKRIKKYYHCDAEVIYPGVDIQKFKIAKKHEDYFLVVSRLSPYKNIELVIKTFNKLSYPLIIIGEGSQREELQKMTQKDNIIFLGSVDDRELVDYYSRARALIFPTFDEDFGLTPIEAMASGRPVIAAGRGGTRETIIEGITGEFFNENTEEALMDAIKRFINNEKSYSPVKIRKHAEKFDLEIFKNKIKSFVEKAYKDFKQKNV